MPQADPATGLRSPIGTERASGPIALQNLVADLRGKVIVPFQTTAARDLAITGSLFTPPGIPEGFPCYVKGIGLMVYRSGWKSVVDMTGANWIDIPFQPSLGWGLVSGAIPRPRYRRFGGQIQFAGGAYTTGALPTTGLRLSPPIPDLANAVPSGAGNQLLMPAGTQRHADNIGMQLLVQEDGSLYAMPSLAVSGATIILYPCQFADAAAG